MLLAQCSDCLFCAVSVLGHLRQATGPRRAGGCKAPKTAKTKTDKDRSGFLQRKVLNPIPPAANPCCNGTLKIGVVLSLGMGDATALQSK
jgi:hypothetical protein